MSTHRDNEPGARRERRTTSSPSPGGCWSPAGPASSARIWWRSWCAGATGCVFSSARPAACAGWRGMPIEYAYGDVRDKASLAGACVGVRSVFHFGGADPGLQSPPSSWRPTPRGRAIWPRRWPSAACRARSSSTAAAWPRAVPRFRWSAIPTPVRTESDPPTPITPYGRSKLQGEVALREVADAHARFRHVILRPPAVYGPRDEGLIVLFRWIQHGILPMPRGPRRASASSMWRIWSTPRSGPRRRRARDLLRLRRRRLLLERGGRAGRP